MCVSLAHRDVMSLTSGERRQDFNFSERLRETMRRLEQMTDSSPCFFPINTFIFIRGKFFILNGKEGKKESRAHAFSKKKKTKMMIINRVYEWNYQKGCRMKNFFFFIYQTIGIYVFEILCTFLLILLPYILSPRVGLKNRHPYRFTQKKG